VKRSSKSKAGHVRKTEPGSRALLPALAVVGGSLVTLPAWALELGDLQVHSSLGQPLRASIAYALAPNEIVSDTCVSVQQVMSADRLPAVGKTSLIVTNGVIAITGSRVVEEPLMAMRVTIDCPYTPHISREYTLFVDPVSFRPATDADQAPPTRASTEAVAPAPRPAARREPIGASTRYRVRVGDSLSEIAERIENRPVGLWPAATAIFEANPAAFIDNDPNKLKAGSWLDIPDFGTGTQPVVAERVTPAAAPAPAMAQPGTAYEPGAGMPAAETGDMAAAPVTENAYDEAVIDTTGVPQSAPSAAPAAPAAPAATTTPSSTCSRAT
jgi:Tfp pilus assembly protein FimV